MSAPELCRYCGPYKENPETKKVTAIDGQEEWVCPDHEWMMNEIGLIAGGMGEKFIELVDHMRDVIEDNTRRYYEMRSVKDLLNDL